MVLIICTKKKSDHWVLRYGSGQTKSVDGVTEGRTDGMDGHKDPKTISLGLCRGIKST